MPLHVLIHGDQRFPSLGDPVVNLDEVEVRRRFVEPWGRGEAVVARGRQYSVGTYWLSIYDGPAFDEPRGSATDITLSNLSVLIESKSTNVSDRFITEPFGAQVPRPTVETDAPQFATDRRKVMVVHGRNGAARQALYDLLRAVDLHPMEWSELVGDANTGAPYIGAVLDDAFAQAQAVVVLFTPDDLARLRPDLLPEDDREGEGILRGQARPNVYYEAGMAMGRFPKRTVLVELGTMRPASDLAGRHAVRISNDAEPRKDLAQRLANAGCLVNTSGDDWLSAGDFTVPDEVAGQTATSPSSELEARVDSLLDELAQQHGYVPWGVAEVYNGLVAESGIEGLPSALAQGTGNNARADAPRRPKMAADEMRIHLGHLRIKLRAGI